MCASTPLLNARHCVAGEKLWISSGPTFLSACHTLEHYRSPFSQVSLEAEPLPQAEWRVVDSGELPAEAFRLPGVRVSEPLQWICG